jgi:hypothetical protein
LVGIGPGTGFIAEDGIDEESLSFPSDDENVLTGVCGEGGVSSVNDRREIRSSNADDDFEERSSAASLIMISRK